MAIRDRYLIRLRNGQGDIPIEVTKQGGTVDYAAPKPNASLYQFMELNSANAVIRMVEVHKDEILAIIRDQAPVVSRRVAKSKA